MPELNQFDEKHRMTEGDRSVTEEFASERQLSLELGVAKCSLIIS